MELLSLLRGGTMSILGRPIVVLPHHERPGCLEAMRAKVDALTGCLTWAIERALWMIAGGVIVLVMKGCER
jgi:hypothetical protein